MLIPKSAFIIMGIILAALTGNAIFDKKVPLKNKVLITVCVVGIIYLAMSQY